MTKDKFHDSATTKDKTEKAGGTTASATPPRPPVMRHPMMTMDLSLGPKPPFYMPPVATNLRPIPAAVPVKKVNEEDVQE